MRPWWICLWRGQRSGVVRGRSRSGARQVGCWLSGALAEWLWVRRRRSCSWPIESRKSVGCPFWRIRKECALPTRSSRLRPFLVLCCRDARVHILSCSRLIRPLTPFGNLGAGFRGKRRRPRHGRRRVASSTSSASGAGSSLCQVKAEACRVRYSSALAERRPRIVASVAEWPHGGRAAKAGEENGGSERLPDSEGGAALHRPVSTKSPPGETNFQTVPRAVAATDITRYDGQWDSAIRWMAMGISYVSACGRKSKVPSAAEIVGGEWGPCMEGVLKEISG